MSSARRLKTDIMPSQFDATSALLALAVKDYVWDDPFDQSYNNRNARGVWTGLIAQEVVEVTPWAVNAPRTLDGQIDHTSERMWQVEFDHLVPVLVKGWQAHESRIAALEKLAGVIPAQPATPVDNSAMRNKAAASQRQNAAIHIARLDAAEKAKAVQDIEDAEKAKQDAAAQAVRDARQALRARLAACEADNDIIVAQGGKPQSCVLTDAEKAERQAMRAEAQAARAKADADRDEQRKQELARCATLNAKIVAAGGKPRVCGSPAPPTGEVK